MSDADTSIRTATDNHILNMIKKSNNFKKVKEYRPASFGDAEFDDIEEPPEELDKTVEAIRLNNYNEKPVTYNMKPNSMVKLNNLAEKAVKIKRNKSSQGLVLKK
tara:strand:- start:57 stop:371 length:315 start_codon:yes stop_codon:yes gene_type:complete